ncbi:hypothetical protein NFI95_11475 [Acetobacteraceae bacterium KSS8]|uniref:Uncharacterized protein n=1 Tax=Endosaccharibacter trunci TaxID=2812733 RepID=A0ABT1W858_9PROT|nr:hypothetical protein [Acetobacteraceae bacterium KSS8]
MNDTAHLMAIIEDKMAQAKTCLRNNDAERADDLMAQVRIYSASLGLRDAPAASGRPVSRSPFGQH